jgi:diguanylate cyclase (GGDEF)-like protein
MVNKIILLVDDNPANLKLLVDGLEDLNLKIAVAQSGEQALRRLKLANLPKPDLILLDVMMPGIDGYETCRRIRLEQDLIDIPIIFLSAASETSDMVHGFAMGAVDYITKPINFAEVIARINTHLELSGLRKELDMRISERTQELVDANVSLRHEIEERKRVEEQVRYIATHDSLTDLPNRMLFVEQLNLLITRAQRCDEQIVLMYLDLDQFKIINDSLGHQAGDMLLSDVADRLKGALRNEDIVARLGGDEFVLCLPMHEKNKDIMAMAKKIFDSLRKPFLMNDLKFHIGASIGIAVYPMDGNEVETLLSKADTAMYHAKQSGRAEIKLYTSELDRTVQDHLNLSNLLIEAINNKELYMEYQLQMDLVTGKIIGAESLMRWRRSNGTFISPADFIPVAEANGLIKELGAMGLRESCAELKRWHDAGFDDLRMSVNISVPQLHSDGFEDTVLSIVKEFQIPPSQLELEITESLLMQYSKTNLNILNTLHNLGIGISVDDFGTGYSSLAYLQDFPVNELKIDQSFIKNIGTEHGNAIPLAIIAMAHTLHLKVVAEGVEHIDQEEFLKSVGCDCAQGFYYSKSVSGDKILEMCKKGVSPANFHK